jgi:hypothetical protein
VASSRATFISFIACVCAWRLKLWQQDERYFHPLNDRLEPEHLKKIPDRVKRALKEMALPAG